MHDPFEIASIVAMIKALRVPAWEATLRMGVAADHDLAQFSVGPDSKCAAENGVDHEEVSVHLLARPQDAEAIAAEVITAMRQRIEVCVWSFANKGCIYWRCRPEMAVAQAFTNKHYHAAGAHYDAWTDKQFDGDGNWLRISAYARLSRSEPVQPTAHPVITAIAALDSARRT